LTRPYWTGDGITLYLGDCREVTEWLAGDVLVTDPPYGRGWRQGNTKARGKRPDSHKGILGDEDTGTRNAALARWGDRAAVVFGDLMLPPPAGTKQVLIWHKTNAGFRGATAGFRRDAEAVYLIGCWPSGLGGCASILRSSARTQGGPAGVTGRYDHPHAKPVDVLETLIAACPPGVIADPFAGSGSTLVAARNQGRQAIGVEIDERYCEMAARRLDQGILAPAGEVG
jgi:site-specific DNA-methyltransferase (adenine-specific)